jgi:hypothetical protein
LLRYKGILEFFLLSLFWLFPTRPQSHFTNEQNMYQGDNNNLNHSIYTDINKYFFWAAHHGSIAAHPVKPPFHAADPYLCLD